QGKIYREGVQTVIIGRPNVGKSSLLNALLGEEKAIVTEIPGTTRDLIEEVYLVQGIPLKLIDTAGLRDSQDPIEQIGIAKTRTRLEQADLIILMLEAGQSLGEAEQEILAAAAGKTLLVVLNKVDLQPHAELDCVWPSVKISAKTGVGLEELKETLASLLLKGELNAPGKILVSNLRHRDILQKARQFLRDFGVSLEAGLALDVADQDLRLAWEALGEICGTTFTEDLLDRIFSNFCLGK
ncbi:MAG: 50S ribosome-binding GTPase, partial [Clostridia bacterium]|nr:50S ribosome-binding GTPase [Clostridia bacterium]